MKKHIFILALLAVFTPVWSQTKMPPVFKSSQVWLNGNGELQYGADKKGNTLPDFSRVGYHHQDSPIPVTTPTLTISPAAGDNTQQIQQAIDQLSQRQPDATGHRGTLLLTKGTYQVDGTISIKQSGIVVRGEGNTVAGTRILATARHKYAVFSISGSGRPVETAGSRQPITDSFVPTGAFSVSVKDASGFSVGDKVMLYRPATQEWIHDLKMDQIVARKGTRQWTPEDYGLAFERQITAIDGKKLTLDNPVVMQMDRKYGGGEVYKYTFGGRISEVGIENLYIESVFTDYEDTAHAWTGVEINRAENCWVSDVATRYMGYAAVFCNDYTKNITVCRCQCLEPKSFITGGYRYAFNNNGQQNLFIDCLSTEGRHDFVTGAKTLGPNVFYRCTAIQSYSDIGPHHRWACGTLFDNVTTDNEINVQDRGNWGSGHGWAGVTQVLWNCKASQVAVQNPWVSGQNYSIGTKCEKVLGRFNDRPDGFWEGQNETNMQLRSLFRAQLMARKGMAQIPPTR